jgi:glycosyltransferase involved in cell wall biosynthesis
VRRQAETLAENGFDVEVVCVLPAPSAQHGVGRFDLVNGVRVHRLPLRKKRGSGFRYFFEFAAICLMGLWKITRLHASRKFDVVHIHNMPDVLVLSGLIAKWTGARLILDVHDPMPELFQENYQVGDRHPLVKILTFQEKLSLRCADHVITVSEPMARNIAAKMGHRRETIGVVHNFPDTAYFPIREPRDRWPKNEQRVYLLYAGTVTEHYRLDVAVRGLALACRVDSRLRLRILGDGPSLQGICALARELDVADKLELLKPVALEQVKDVMSAADIGISTHQSGVFGDLYFSNKVVEYMTQALPVVCSRTQSLEEYIPENALFYVAPGDSEAFAGCILEMLRNPQLVQKRRENARALLDRYVWQVERKKLLRIYEDIVRVW